MRNPGSVRGELLYSLTMEKERWTLRVAEKDSIIEGGGI